MSPPGGVSARGVSGPGGCLLWECLVPGVGGSAPGGGSGGDTTRMATAVGGTHPTGMHSCFTGVCHSVHGGGWVCGRHPPGQTPPG